MKILAITSVSILLAASAAKGEEEFTQVASLSPAKAKADAVASARRGDTRLIAIQQFTLVVPGSGLGKTQARALCGLRVVERVYDPKRSKEEIEKNYRIQEYATLYNKTMVPLCKKRKVAP